MTQEIHRQFEKELPVKLGGKELLEVAISKANAEAELEQEQAKFEDVKREWGAKLKNVEKRIATMGTELRTREQRRMVPCYERWRDGATLEIVRGDTGEVIDVRTATMKDKQPNLPETTGEPAAATEVQTGFPEDEEDDAAGDEEASDEKPDEKKPVRRRKGRNVH